MAGILTPFACFPYLFGESTKRLRAPTLAVSFLPTDEGRFVPLSNFPLQINHWRLLMATVEERVVDIVAEQLGVEKDKISRETSFVNDLGADSLDTVELVMELEEEFNISIPDEAAEKIQKVGEAVDFIENAKGEDA